MSISRILSVTTMIAGFLASALGFADVLPKSVAGVLIVASALVAAFNESIVKAFNVPTPDTSASVQALARLSASDQAANASIAAVNANIAAVNQSAQSAQPAASEPKHKWLSILGIVGSVAGPVLSGINPAIGAAVSAAGNLAASSGGSLKK